MTVQVFGCEACGRHWRRVGQRDSHACPAKLPLQRLEAVDTEQEYPRPAIWNTDIPPLGWVLYTDGSGGKEAQAAEGEGAQAGPGPVAAGAGRGAGGKGRGK